VNVPLSRLPERMATLPRDQAIVVYCASGYRSAIAASLLQRDGFPDVADLIGGLPAWEARTQAEPADPAGSPSA
jgi:rhodanese-related sulfurtransferase